ncbi:MAG: hypothetical protein J6K48_00055 [Lachnospiraceae bacterium]|nr:hypothetical protein [Lachnospiraceae bacterium]
MSKNRKVGSEEPAQTVAARSALAAFKNYGTRDLPYTVELINTEIYHGEKVLAPGKKRNMPRQWRDKHFLKLKRALIAENK